MVQSFSETLLSIVDLIGYYNEVRASSSNDEMLMIADGIGKILLDPLKEIAKDTFLYSIDFEIVVDYRVASQNTTKYRNWHDDLVINFRIKDFSNKVLKGYLAQIRFNEDFSYLYLTLAQDVDYLEKHNFTIQQIEEITNFWIDNYILQKPKMKLKAHHGASDNLEVIQSIEYKFDSVVDDIFEHDFKQTIKLLYYIFEKIGYNVEAFQKNIKYTKENLASIEETQKFIEHINSKAVYTESSRSSLYVPPVTPEKESIILTKYQKALKSKKVKTYFHYINHLEYFILEVFDGEQILTRVLNDNHLPIYKLILNQREKQFFRESMPMESFASLIFFIEHVLGKFGI